MSNGTYLDEYHFNKEQREVLSNHIEILSDFENLMHPNDKYTDTARLSDFLETPRANINHYVNRNKEELEVVTLKGDELKEYKEGLDETYDYKLKAKQSVKLLSKKSVLILIMIMTSSNDIIKDLKAKLEEIAKNKGIEITHNQNWDNNFDKTALEIIENNIRSGHSLQKSFELVSEKINFTVARVSSRWYRHLKNQCSKDVLSMLSENKERKFVRVGMEDFKKILEYVNENKYSKYEIKDILNHYQK